MAIKAIIHTKEHLAKEQKLVDEQSKSAKKSTAKKAKADNDKASEKSD